MIFFPSFSTIILLIYTVRIFQSLFIDEINDVLVCMCEFSSCDSFIWFLFHLITYSCNKIFINSIVFISKSILLLVCVCIYIHTTPTFEVYQERSVFRSMVTVIF